MKTWKLTAVVYGLVVMVGCAVAIAQFDPIGSGSGSGTISGLTILNTTLSDGILKFTGGAHNRTVTIQKSTDAAVPWALKVTDDTSAGSSNANLYFASKPGARIDAPTSNDFLLAAYADFTGVLPGSGLLLDTNGGQPVYTIQRPIRVYGDGAPADFAFGVEYHGTNSASLVMKEGLEPSTPPVDKATLWVRDNGAGKTQLSIKFADGSIKDIVTQD